jgi:hypothetical protein
MAVHHGNDGIVKIATASVAEVQNWNYEEKDISIVEKTSMGDTAASYLPSGCKAGSGSVECVLDEADATGQKAMTPGATVALKLYPEGSGAGSAEYSGSVVIESVAISGPKDGLNTASFKFLGVLTRATVSGT